MKIRNTIWAFFAFLSFYFFLVPVGLVYRLFGRDRLGLRKRAAESYWLDHGESE